MDVSELRKRILRAIDEALKLIDSIDIGPCSEMGRAGAGMVKQIIFERVRDIRSKYASVTNQRSKISGSKK